MNRKIWYGALLGMMFAGGAVLQGCNGGGSGDTTAGVGSGGSGYSTGTVTGFGSVIVDGETLDDRNATVFTEISGGGSEASDVKLGQQVEIEKEKDGVAKSIQVQAQVIGLVQLVDTVGQKLTVAGQAVSVNTNADLGPVTVFEGYTSLADIQLGDAVEVHGIPKADPAGVVNIQATRIEKKANLAFVRVSSKVSNLATGSKTFMLGSLIVDYSSATIVPASRQLAEGQRVVVYGPSVSGNTLAARFIRIAEPKAKGVDIRLGGVVSNYSSATQSFEVNGVKVNAANAVITPANRSISNGVYVTVKGVYADNGELTASKVDIRRKADIVVEVTLKGSITDFDSAASFRVRGVPVDASSATLSGCTAGLSAGLYVEVEGNVSKTGIVATKVSCKEAPDTASIEVRGVAGNVDNTARTFVLTAGGKTFDVRWTDVTRFSGISSTNLSGSLVKVEGYLQSGVLVAKKISR